MTDDIKGLIEKIQQEGINTAQARAKDIEAQAKKEAQAIIEKAKADAKNLAQEARSNVSLMQRNTQDELIQVSRDMLLQLRKEINNTLNKLILTRVREALSPDELGKIIISLVKDYAVQEKEGVVVSLNKDDLEKMGKVFLGELKEELKKKIVLKPSDDISGGFIISYDAEKSHYDFTDSSLAGYISSCLKPKLDQLLKEALTQS